ncbi:hypothetical protein [Roseobacter sp. MH60115]|uniref:hypothetical protein n=1 Tax=Roseobacter sp. MH60115 TaxID=2785324 RepID=UPI0018A31F0F|nr:hypothetical protein [Roseobacter sp. MH60115]
MLETLREMQARVNGLPHLNRLGRLFSCTVLLKIDDAEFYLTFEKGQLTSLFEGPSRKTPWQFSLTLDANALQKFWEPHPAPGFHDIFGLVKIGRATVEGDILLLVKNLRFFKEFMALARQMEQTT